MPGAGSQSRGSDVPRIYYLHPWIGRDLGWEKAAEEAAALGFSHLLLGWPFGRPGDLFATRALGRIGEEDAGSRITALAEACRRLGLRFWIDLAVSEVEADGEVARARPELWRVKAGVPLDPRRIEHAGHCEPVLDTPEGRDAFSAFWAEQLTGWQQQGVSGVRCHQAAALSPDLWQAILGPARQAGDFAAFGWTAGATREAMLAAAGTFDFLTSSTALWTGTERWLFDEYAAVSAKAGGTRLLAFPEDPFAARHPAAHRDDPVRRGEMACAAAALLADGWLMPMGFEFGMEAPYLHATPEDFALARAGTADLRAAISHLNDQSAGLSVSPARRMRPVTLAPRATVVLRQGADEDAQLVILNRDTVNELPLAAEAEAAHYGFAVREEPASAALRPASGLVLPLEPSPPILPREAPAFPENSILVADRIAIEAVSPVVEGGRFAAKRSVGDVVTVEADIFGDGHEVLAAELRWRPDDQAEWTRVPMRPLGNDRWAATFPLLRIGRHLFAVEAWWSEFGTFRRDLAKKRDAGLDIALEITEGRLLLEKVARAAKAQDRRIIAEHLDRLGASQDEDAALLLSESLAAAMAAADPKPHATGADRLYAIEADREAARFSSWYELFPRSITDSPARHGTFRDVIGRLPAIQAMGFDVLYFPPIHPIGKTNRKGRNNSLVAGADDPGSPYAIGAAEGGHDAIHPELGSLDDFLALVREAERHGLEIALDFAIQCSPDHPWLKQHPDWFSWRPDGSMRYAENPPKKYQDIVNVDFYGPGAIPGLWLALRDAVQFWVDQGVRIFRVDNPHTKPFPFWEWLIADIRSRDPRVLFLAEAFTRPKVMYRLGKVGFSQSYTYFTWRNSKYELTEYLTELNAVPARDVYRPHFFVNTPDINPVFLQTSGRPGFLIRAALAATLSGLWGVYSGFELCESAPVPGKEEYLDSEKYEIKPRDWQAPGNIIAEITRLNAIRREHPALQSHLGLSFYGASDDNILCFGKRAGADGEIILVAVNLDPHAAHSAAIEVPLWEYGLPDDASVEVEDLMLGHRFRWHGKTQTIHLDPHALPFSIWRIALPGGSRR